MSFGPQNQFCPWALRSVKRWPVTRAKKLRNFPKSIILAIAQLGQWGPSRLGQHVGTPACPCGLPASLPQHGKQHDFLVFARGPSAPSRASKHVRSRLFHRWAARFVLRKILTLPRLLLPSRPRPVPPCPACHPHLAGMCRPASPLLAVPRAALRGTPAWMIRRGLHAALTTMCTRLSAQMPA